MSSPQNIHVLIVAAGSGQRARGSSDNTPKQYRKIAGKALLRWTVEAFKNALPAATISVVIGEGQEQAFADALGDWPAIPFVTGGATRQLSVLAGLESIAKDDPSVVLVHDAVRPFINAGLIRRVIETLGGEIKAALPAIRPVDTLRATEGETSGAIVDRDRLLACQTPQGFDFPSLFAAHRKAADAGEINFTDDVAVMEWAGHCAAIVEGDPLNTKITYPEDFELAQKRLGGQTMLIRTGQGYDVHRLAVGLPLWLGGIEIPHSHGLSGHSDADVALHAITDALFGAMADGDIGTHFPPSDAKWKGAASDQFLAYAAERLRQRGGEINNIDLTIICEQPKIAPHSAAMRERIAHILSVKPGRISVKATTSEKLGFTGRGEGIAAMATATVSMPDEDD